MVRNFHSYVNARAKKHCPCILCQYIIFTHIIIKLKEEDEKYIYVYIQKREFNYVFDIRKCTYFFIERVRLFGLYDTSE